MDFSIGSEVRGTNGKLGEVQRVIVDAKSNTITDLVVKHGFLFGNERILPLGDVRRVEDGVVYVEMDEKHFETLNGFTTARFHDPAPGYAGPAGLERGGFLIGGMGGAAGVAGLGGLAGVGDVIPTAGTTGPGIVSASPGGTAGEQVSPADMQRPAISKGADILASDGEKVGEVGELSVSETTGQPEHMTIRRGALFKSETELPMSWIQEISDKGIVLNVPKQRVEELVDRPKEG